MGWNYQGLNLEDVLGCRGLATLRLTPLKCLLAHNPFTSKVETVIHLVTKDLCGNLNGSMRAWHLPEHCDSTGLLMIKSRKTVEQKRHQL